MGFGMQRRPAYDLTLRFNEQIRGEVALEALWSHPTLDGPYSESVKVPIEAYFARDFSG